MWGQHKRTETRGDVVVKYVLCVVSTHKAIAPYPYIWQHSASCATHCMAT